MNKIKVYKKCDKKKIISGVPKVVSVNANLKRVTFRRKHGINKRYYLRIQNSTNIITQYEYMFSYICGTGHFHSVVH